MSDIPVTSPNQTGEDVEYDEPGIEDMNSLSEHPITSYPYDIPEIHFIDGISTSPSRPIQYQELDINNTISHDYQTLQNSRTAVVNSAFIQSEEPNSYEPLRKKREPVYQELDRVHVHFV